MDAINGFARHEADLILNAARDIANADQRAALADYECNIRRRR